ncbi:MAG: YihY/virulence factor BrkB family protein, partial [Rhizonema sp. NSF051]|nr:YihY/virulence factor BrkB family protein [Rhizonema sp. NSF051]
TILSTIVTYFGHLIPGGDFLWAIVNSILSFAVTAVLFGLIFKVLPDVKITWSDVSIGAILTAILFSIGKFLLEKYLVSGSFGSAYGAAGSIVVVLAWVNYAAQILFFGAEFTKVYAKKYGSRIVPSKNAVPIGDTGNQLVMKLNRNNSWISRLRRRFTRAKPPKRR